MCDLYSLISTSQTIIYCNHHQSVEVLTKKLQESTIFQTAYELNSKIIDFNNIPDELVAEFLQEFLQEFYTI